MLIDEGMDTGPVLLTRTTAIGRHERAPSLEGRLAKMGAELLVKTLGGLEEGTLQPTPQDETQASYAPLIRKEDGRLDWTQPALALERRVRAFQPWPGTVTTFAGRQLKVLKARAGGPTDGEPGTVVGAEDGLYVACGDRRWLALDEVQPESRRPMPAAAFVAGARIAPGVRLG
jgi:methionyl-tRNA formyltransferase